MPDRDEIAREALALPPEDRAYLAEVLEQSLDTGTFVTPQIAEAWSKEIDRRIAAYDRGETKALSFEESTARLREALAARSGAAKTP
jgi:putative addiction module component (TIGR02574 family)